MLMPYTSIRELAEELHSGLITPAELVAETLAQIDAQDGELQAFVSVMREQAFEDAERLEREQRTGLYRSQLHGVPIAVKDLIAVKDVRLTASSRVLADYVAVEDAMVVEQLRKAGAIIIGKTNTYEFAYGPYAPPTRNPWNAQHTTGGSSGGSAAADRYGWLDPYSGGLLRRDRPEADLWTRELLWRYSFELVAGSCRTPRT